MVFLSCSRLFVLLSGRLLWRTRKLAHSTCKSMSHVSFFRSLLTQHSGLGIGTTPSAFVKHGIDTTIVEIDPAVHEFAQKYFDLRENNPAAVHDAVSYTADLVKQS